MIPTDLGPGPFLPRRQIYAYATLV
jgi:hypothetical protein